MHLGRIWGLVTMVSLLSVATHGDALVSVRSLMEVVDSTASPAPLPHRWKADDNLRRYMMPLHALALKHVALARHARITNEDYVRWGSQAERQVAIVISHCELPPAPDAALHGILVEIAQGAAAMEGRTAETSRQGARRMVDALNRYGVVFKHPGWNLIPDPE